MTITANLRGVEEQLRRIADALDRINPPIDLERAAIMKKRGPESIIRYGDNQKLWARQTFANLIHEQGLAPASEQELLDQMMEEAEENEMLQP